MIAVEVTTPAEDPFTIYDRSGSCVGRVCRETGRALICGEFWSVVSQNSTGWGRIGEEGRISGKEGAA